MNPKIVGMTDHKWLTIKYGDRKPVKYIFWAYQLKCVNYSGNRILVWKLIFI